MEDSRKAFFRQSGWLALANTFSGVFLMAVYALISPWLSGTEIGIYASILRFFAILSIPVIGLQVVMSQDAASAVTDEHRAQLRCTARAVFKGIVYGWLVLALLCALFQERMVAGLQLTHAFQPWLAVLLVLAALLLPAVQGLLQGLQRFGWLGLSTICNGLGRFVAVLACVVFLKGQATGALVGALIGLGAAVLAGFVGAREVFRPASGRFDWVHWLKRALPLTLAFGSSLFLMNADLLFVQTHFPAEAAKLYAAAGVVGVGLVTFTAPLAAVMFPKLVRSVAQARSSNSLTIALVGTAAMAGAGALLCTFWPELPLRIMFPRRPEMLAAAPLLPWFMWGFAPITVANVLISNLIAQRVYGVAPWLALVAAADGLALYSYVRTVETIDPIAAFTRIVQIVAGFSVLLLIVAAIFTVRLQRQSSHRTGSGAGRDQS
jgi:O-antigen/teichoic acid export membrane protein